MPWKFGTRSISELAGILDALLFGRKRNLGLPELTAMISVCLVKDTSSMDGLQSRQAL
jgi:hypothetical protein